MALPNMPDDQIRSALKELEQAIYIHGQWAERLYGTLICRLAPDQRDLSEEAYRFCQFGQWYYSQAAELLRQHPGFVEIGDEHKRMHRYAATLLTCCAGGVPIEISDYEQFVTALRRLRLEVATVQRELEDAHLNLDPLTGASSRLGMLTKLREYHELARRRAIASTIAMMDLDHFKSVNDTYGHVVGDRVLIAKVRYAMEHLRPYDKMFRYGGEEFLISLPDTDLPEALRIVERLHEGMGSIAHDTGGEGALTVTVSFGVTRLDPEVSVEQAIERADKALYVAKTTGRNRVVVWDSSMTTHIGDPGHPA